MNPYKCNMVKQHMKHRCNMNMLLLNITIQPMQHMSAFMQQCLVIMHDNAHDQVLAIS
jgi:hypothetical protein